MESKYVCCYTVKKIALVIYVISPSAVDISRDKVVPIGRPGVKNMVSPPISAHESLLAVVLPKFAMHAGVFGIGNDGSIHGVLHSDGTSTQTDEGSVTIFALIVSDGFSDVNTFIMLPGLVVDPGYNF